MTLTSFFGCAKHSREDFKDEPILSRPYPHNPSLCPVLSMVKNMEMTAPMSGHDEVFVISAKDHTPAHHDTIANWIKHILTCAGIDTGTYGALNCRSTSAYKAANCRAASTTKAALAGVSLQTIMKSASWTSVNTFKQHYFKEIKEHFDLFQPNFDEQLLENFSISTGM